ncbi:MAG: tRNA (adenosine(37)-N6)-dimethylallyltransferase MiaA [Xanthomonadaceae bacterium]|jgi:tRNA dimethylallyltransferase|nr:tRNA (adenosine(37)-N6)-dimethylallyltransferase MiaA [Xanthomonadaceae bacterium]
MNDDKRPLAIAVMGPTASGKTAFAIELAERWNGEILSVDSALIYRRLDIGTAKPAPMLRQRIPHHLIDLREPWQNYSAAEFSSDARACLNDVVGRGKIPVLAGGTGLYFRALLRGLSPMPEADAAIRAEIAAEAAVRGWPALHSDLRRIDPVAAARIHPTDPQRIQRALEVFRASGRPISAWQREGRPQRPPLRVLKLILAPRERAVLHTRIEKRFDEMLASGFLDEVRNLRTLPGLNAVAHPLDLPSLRAVGYRQAWQHLDGETDAALFRDRAIHATRQLAKRQMTWLRGELDARWFDLDYDARPLWDAIRSFLDRGGTALCGSGASIPP